MSPNTESTVADSLGSSQMTGAVKNNEETQSTLYLDVFNDKEEEIKEHMYGNYRNNCDFQYQLKFLNDQTSIIDV